MSSEYSKLLQLRYFERSHWSCCGQKHRYLCRLLFLPRATVFSDLLNLVTKIDIRRPHPFVLLKSSVCLCPGAVGFQSHQCVLLTSGSLTHTWVWPTVTCMVTAVVKIFIFFWLDAAVKLPPKAKVIFIFNFLVLSGWCVQGKSHFWHFADCVDAGFPGCMFCNCTCEYIHS